MLGLEVRGLALCKLGPRLCNRRGGPPRGFIVTQEALRETEAWESPGPLQARSSDRWARPQRRAAAGDPRGGAWALEGGDGSGGAWGRGMGGCRAGATRYSRTGRPSVAPKVPRTTPRLSFCRFEISFLRALERFGEGERGYCGFRTWLEVKIKTRRGVK